MTRPVDRLLTPEEQAQVLDVQERLIDLFVDRGAAISTGDRDRATALQGEIDDLMRQRENIKSRDVADGK